MKRSVLVCLALVLSVGSVAVAQHPPVDVRPVATLQPPTLPASEQFTTPSVSLPNVTPEVWLYTQEWRRHDDPAQAVRRKAEARAAGRIQRLEAMRWFGFSNARPQASVTP